MKSFVLITGATGGLGKAFSIECASRGMSIFLTDIAEYPLSLLADSISRTYGTDVEFYAADLSDKNGRKELSDIIKGRNIFFNMLINVAGLDFEGEFSERTGDEITTILRVNIEANLEMTSFAMKKRDASRPFRIINVSSLAAFYPMPVKAIYAASKRFLLDFSFALREELREQGGSVTVLCPAGMPTNESCIRSIDSQGLAGKITSKNVGFVAAKTLDHANKGHLLYIPGIVNRLLKYAGGIVPPSVLAYLIGKRWSNTRRELSVS